MQVEGAAAGEIAIGDGANWKTLRRWITTRLHKVFYMSKHKAMNTIIKQL
jgi:hypothetical protein